jgi:hypothetical protein
MGGGKLVRGERTDMLYTKEVKGVMCVSILVLAYSLGHRSLPLLEHLLVLFYFPLLINNKKLLC